MCPKFMAMGVSYDEFWNGDYTRLKYYEEAYKQKLKDRNTELWLQGVYVYEAVSVALYNLNRKKGAPSERYSKEPHRIFPLTKKEQEEENKKKVEEFRAALNAFGKRCEERHKQQGR